MKSIGKLRRSIGKKTLPPLVETLIAARKQKAWHRVAYKLAGPTRKHASVNLDYIERHTKEGDTVIVTGKVLSSGSVSKRIRIGALSFSQAAHQKLKTGKAEIIAILDEIKKNPKAEGVKVLP